MDEETINQAKQAALETVTAKTQRAAAEKAIDAFIDKISPISPEPPLHVSALWSIASAPESIRAIVDSARFDFVPGWAIHVPADAADAPLDSLMSSLRYTHDHAVLPLEDGGKLYVGRARGLER